MTDISVKIILRLNRSKASVLSARADRSVVAFRFLLSVKKMFKE